MLEKITEIKDDNNLCLCNNYNVEVDNSKPEVYIFCAGFAKTEYCVHGTCLTEFNKLIKKYGNKIYMSDYVYKEIKEKENIYNKAYFKYIIG